VVIECPRYEFVGWTWFLGVCNAMIALDLLDASRFGLIKRAHATVIDQELEIGLMN